MKILAVPTNRVFQGAATRRCPLCRCNLPLSADSLEIETSCPSCGLNVKLLEATSTDQPTMPITEQPVTRSESSAHAESQQRPESPLRFEPLFRSEPLQRRPEPAPAPRPEVIVQKRPEPAPLKHSPIKLAIKPATDPVDQWLTDGALAPTNRGDLTQLLLWIRRHPRLSTFAGSLLAAAVAIPIGLYMAYTNTAESLRAATLARNAAEAQRVELSVAVSKNETELKAQQDRWQIQQLEHEWLKGQFSELQSNYQQSEQQCRTAESLLHSAIRESLPVHLPKPPAFAPSITSTAAPFTSTTPTTPPTAAQATTDAAPTVLQASPVAPIAAAPLATIQPTTPALGPAPAAVVEVAPLAVPEPVVPPPARVQAFQTEQPQAAPPTSVFVIREIQDDSSGPSLDGLAEQEATSSPVLLQPSRSIVDRMLEMQARSRSSVTANRDKSDLFRLD
jgi:hypothetical protein